jgi:hypothetical protein
VRFGGTADASIVSSAAKRGDAVVDGVAEAGQELLDVEHHHQRAVLELGHGGDQTRRLAREHVRRNAHPRPVHAQDGVHLAHEEALGLTVVLGHDHDLGLRPGRQAHVLREVHHRHELAAQADHAFHGRRHLGRARDHRGAHDLAHLEHVQAEDFAAAALGILAEREHQDLEPVGARELGSAVDAFQ